ncbi:CIS tube protein [Nitrosospira sp. Is2]|uniref:CIS tube protein n=1 Tax=Nitrosospira sp. Is2 TaxID=3080532 RepID=UPI00295324D1|nr:LysM peptidoglycan-binding domain-containing protein [Nitrosospira sp. Is2]WON73514.1 LysM peptidoglycan-binding domain-containing protein [Nitrosospira sp. Is2]
MGPLARLGILIELPGGQFQFDEKNPACFIEAKFNPDRLSTSRSAQWKSQPVTKRDCPELQFTGSEPGTLGVDLFFDTYDSPYLPKRSVVKDYTSKLHHLTTVEKHGTKHRPPLCRLKWGEMGIFFQGVLQQLDLVFTLFTEEGIPVRATAKCTFKQWRQNSDDLQKQDLLSSDVAKVWVVKRGQTLATIAAQEYGDTRKWRSIARANGIEDPTDLYPGSVLLLPALRAS